jgi:hypothetical protein
LKIKTNGCLTLNNTKEKIHEDWIRYKRFYFIMWKYR